MLISNQENYFLRRIGSTTYKVKVFFNDTAKESMEEKILRMIKNEVSTTAVVCDTIDVSQVSCPA